MNLPERHSSLPHDTQFYSTCVTANNVQINTTVTDISSDDDDDYYYNYNYDDDNNVIGGTDKYNCDRHQ